LKTLQIKFSANLFLPIISSILLCNFWLFYIS